MTRFTTPLGEIAIQHLGHASLLIKWEENNIFVDPYSEVADYSLQPKADLILLTHHHYDHLDSKALVHIDSEKTVYVTNIEAAKSIHGANVLAQGEVFNYKGIRIKAVYAYNIENRRDDGHPFHPRGEGNGYILDFDGFKLYIAGDTEIIPEMKEIGEIDLAFLPKNLPYTMSDDMFIKAVELIRPKMVFPYHFFELDAEKLRARMPNGVQLITQ
ncbi:MAG: MBL fold metallo-hydrolase [Bacteroidales bacterium]|jgi:L-ascorbate metabolism protein UlaG (beta-lactamase superfamily)|nr:MBL fold metallo-hydrolase [Bacteroidales bacterium]MDD3273639.1 MBL fold metallo-hydrolase [Bacteroidales bacterium]MDD4058061.1 MBL fold metallo-hydrolase [Bacteroidales bacterium]